MVIYNYVHMKPLRGQFMKQTEFQQIVLQYKSAAMLMSILVL